MNLFKKRPGADQLLLAAVWITISVSTILWTLRDRTPPPWDPADHLTAAYDYSQPLAHGDFAGFAREFFHEHHYYAPLVHLATGIFYLVLGASRLSGIAVNLLSILLLLCSVYWIGGKLYGRQQIAVGAGEATAGENNESATLSRWHISPGALAAVLATCYHFMGWLVHDAFLDYPEAYAKPLILAIESAMTLTIAVTLGLLLAGPPEQEAAR